MQPINPRRFRRGPERTIQEGILAALKAADWFCISTHGNEYQMGLPDVWASHAQKGYRWIEVKNPAAYSFTEAQQKVFPRMFDTGVGIWILFGDTPEELAKLFKPANGREVFYRWLLGVKK